jgi:poly-gamma-glutamate synthesis protein (capsule biosynthesis protein)
MLARLINRWTLAAVVSASVVAALGSAAAAIGQANAQTPGAAPAPVRAWTLAAVGDALIATRLPQLVHNDDPVFSRIGEIVRRADAGFVNLEGSFFRFSEFKGWGEVEQGGFWQVGPPEAAEDLKALGFSLYNTANNHTTDWGVEGMRMTLEVLDRLGMVHSGSGMNLGLASRPGYLDTPRARVALIGLATTFTPMSRAGAARPDLQGRPGLNALRVDRRYEADAALFQSLSAAAPALGGRPPQDGTLRLFGATVTKGTETKMKETVNPRDEERILHEVRNAAKLADYVIVNSHSHEPGNDVVVPPPWLVEFAKKCIDAGAAAYIVHGPHQLRGIELHRGRPIFYSLGDFIFHEELYDPLPADMYEIFDVPQTSLQSDMEDVRFKGGTIGFPSNPVWYESVIAVPTFRGQEMTELKLYPIDLNRTAPRSQRGTPRMADEPAAKRIIERLAQESQPFGTTIRYEGGIGVWRRDPSKTSSSKE